MDINTSFQAIQKISLSMFRKGFLGIFHGSISAKLQEDQYIINKKDAIFDNLQLEDMIVLHKKKDYGWNDASGDTDTHINIYKNIKEAKYVAYTMPPYTVACSLISDLIIPKDYYGCMKFGKIKIYDIKQFDNWSDRAPHEIYKYMLDEDINYVVVKGHGVYSYAKTPIQLAKDVAILENSCKILTYCRQVIQENVC